MHNKKKVAAKSDWVGIVSSGFCLVHCFVPPLLIFFQVNYATYLERSLHGFTYLFLAISLAAVWSTTRRSTSKRVKAWLWACMGIFSVAAVLHSAFAFMEPVGYLASLGLIIGHVLNMRHCHKCTTIC